MLYALNSNNILCQLYSQSWKKKKQSLLALAWALFLALSFPFTKRTLRKGSERCEKVAGCKQGRGCSPETEHAGTLTLNFHHLELWEIFCCLSRSLDSILHFPSPGLCCYFPSGRVGFHRPSHVSAPRFIVISKIVSGTPSCPITIPSPSCLLRNAYSHLQLYVILPVFLKYLPPLVDELHVGKSLIFLMYHCILDTFFFF